MKNITKKGIKQDLETIKGLFDKYSDAIWENQEGQKAHFDNQLKLVKIAMCDIRAGLWQAKTALHEISEIEIIED